MKAGERVTRSIERQLRGLALTNAQAARITEAARISAMTATDPLGPPREPPADMFRLQ